MHIAGLAKSRKRQGTQHHPEQQPCGHILNALGFERMSKCRSDESCDLAESLNAAVINDGLCGLAAMCETLLLLEPSNDHVTAILSRLYV